MSIKRFSLLFAVMLVSAALAQTPTRGRSPAGWYDLFPPYAKHFFPMYDAPAVLEEMDAKAYSQTARFDQMTGLVRAFGVTVARDPAFKKRYARETLATEPASPLEIGKRTAWVWKDGTKVVVPLGDDKAVVIQSDPNAERMQLTDYAKSLDYDRIEVALAHPPRRDLGATVETFAPIKKGGNAAAAIDWLGIGESQGAVGPKEDQRFRWTYALKDGSKVAVTVAGAVIESVVRTTADGKTVDLSK